MKLRIFFVALLAVLSFTSCDDTDAEMYWYDCAISLKLLESVPSWEYVGEDYTIYIWFDDSKIHVFKDATSLKKSFAADYKYEKIVYNGYRMEFYINELEGDMFYVSVNLRSNTKLTYMYVYTDNSDISFMSHQYTKSKWHFSE